MSVNFRSFVNNNLFDERAQYFGRELFKTVMPAKNKTNPGLTAYFLLILRSAPVLYIEY